MGLHDYVSLLRLHPQLRNNSGYRQYGHRNAEGGIIRMKIHPFCQGTDVFLSQYFIKNIIAFLIQIGDFPVEGFIEIPGCHASLLRQSVTGLGIKTVIKLI